MMEALNGHFVSVGHVAKRIEAKQKMIVSKMSHQLEVKWNSKLYIRGIN